VDRRLRDELADRGVPFLVTLHTVLSEPSPAQARRAEPAVPERRGGDRLHRDRAAPGHRDPDRAVGPDRPRPARRAAARLRRRRPARGAADPGRAGRLPAAVHVRLISPGKGLETAIEALALISSEHPDVRYLIAGSTHPEIARQYGEDYRARLAQATSESGLDDRRGVLDTFLTDAEIAAVLDRTEVFCTPYRSRERSRPARSHSRWRRVAPWSPRGISTPRTCSPPARGSPSRPKTRQPTPKALHTLLSDDGQLRAAAASANTLGADFALDIGRAPVRRHHPDSAARRPRPVPAALAARRCRPCQTAVASAEAAPGPI